MSFTPTYYARVTRSPSRMRTRSFATSFKAKSPTLGESILNASMLSEPVLNEAPLTEINIHTQEDAASFTEQTVSA